MPNGKMFESKRLKKKQFPQDTDRFMKIYANKSIRATSLSAELAIPSKYSNSRNTVAENPYHLAADGLEPRSFRHLTQTNLKFTKVKDDRIRHQSIQNTASECPEFLMSASSRIIGQQRRQLHQEVMLRRNASEGSTCAKMIGEYKIDKFAAYKNK